MNDTNTTSNASTFAYTIEYDSNTATCTTTPGTSYDSDGNLIVTIKIVRTPPPRPMNVEIPADWDQAKMDDFADLVNNRTKTGWRILQLVRVHKVYDKSVVRISMFGFQELMLHHASKEDADAINAWFWAK